MRFTPKPATVRLTISKMPTDPSATRSSMFPQDSQRSPNVKKAMASAPLQIPPISAMALPAERFCFGWANSVGAAGGAVGCSTAAFCWFVI